jgi:hypothetical protein
VRGFDFEIWLGSKNFKIVSYDWPAEKIAPLRPCTHQTAKILTISKT